MNTFESPITSNALQKVPVWNSPKDGYQVKNWMAFISPDPQKRPFHLERHFASKASKFSGGVYVVTSDFQIGRPVEFGSTVTPASGSAQPAKFKWYGVITAIRHDMIEFVRCDSADEALNWKPANAPEEDLQTQINRKTVQIGDYTQKLEEIQSVIQQLIEERDELMIALGTKQPEVEYSAVDDLFANFNL